MGKINKVKKIWVPIQNKELIGDIAFNISIQCLNCKYFSGKPITCEAYKEGIPKEIIDGDIDHSKPYEGDNSIRYEPIGKILK